MRKYILNLFNFWRSGHPELKTTDGGYEYSSENVQVKYNNGTTGFGKYRRVDKQMGYGNLCFDAWDCEDTNIRVVKWRPILNKLS